MVAIIVPGNTWLFPYLGIFKTALERTGMDYEVVCWNREGLEENVAVSYSKPLPLNCSMPAKIAGYAAYARYLEKTVSSRKYDKLIFLTPLVALFMRNFLRKHYYKRFWLDYRDMSWELKIKPWFDSLAGMAAGISVSSPAYRDLMPQSSVLCHNLDLDRLERALGENSPMKQASDKIVVSNIGYIRHFGQQKEIIDALANDNDIEIRFCGDGSSVEDLRAYVQDNGISNVSFSGRYVKDEEARLFEEADFANIYLPETKALLAAMSNRFYQCVLYGCLMIVNEDSVQAEYVKDYGLGLYIRNCEGLAYKLKAFDRSNPEILNSRRCLLKKLSEEQQYFVSELTGFAKQ